MGGTVTRTVIQPAYAIVFAVVPGPAERFKAVHEAAGLRPAAAPRPIDSDSNDAWHVSDERLGEIVVRVGWRGDITRLGREMAVATHLPAAVRYPRVVGHGHAVADGHLLTYTLTRKLSGRPLDHHWAALAEGRLRTAVSQLAEMLRELHSWRPPAHVADAVRARPDLKAGTITGLIGSDVTPLPLPRAVALASHAATLPYVDNGLIAEAVAAMQDLHALSPVLDDPARHGLVHGDLHLNNLWCSANGDVVLLDLEWVRFGPPSFDLLRLCDSADEDVLRGNDMHPSVLRWLAAGYPELFGEPDLPARLRLYSMAFAIREIILTAPDRPDAPLRPDHALHRLRRLLDGDWPAPGSLPVGRP